MSEKEDTISKMQAELDDAIYKFVNKTANKDAGVFRNGLKLGFKAGSDWQKEHCYTEQEWIKVDSDADVKDTDLQHFETYFIVLSENGNVRQATFCNWDTEGVPNTWIINDEEYPLTIATHYQQVVYPNPPVK